MTTAQEITDTIETLRSGHEDCSGCRDVRVADLIERLAGELAKANVHVELIAVELGKSATMLAARDAELAAMQTANYDGGQAHVETLAQLAARDAELKVCREALERIVAVNRRAKTSSPECAISATALAKLTKKEET